MHKNCALKALLIFSSNLKNQIFSQGHTHYNFQGISNFKQFSKTWVLSITNEGNKLVSNVVCESLQELLNFSYQHVNRMVMEKIGGPIPQ